MKVLSLFDGLSGGQIALKRIGVKIDQYYASEVDKYAIAIAKKNNPEMVHLGDVTKWRKLTPLECERLQTVPEGYTEGVSNSQRYKMLGNGWTVDVIAHIFKEGLTND